MLGPCLLRKEVAVSVVCCVLFVVLGNLKDTPVITTAHSLLLPASAAFCALLEHLHLEDQGT